MNQPMTRFLMSLLIMVTLTAPAIPQGVRDSLTAKDGLGGEGAVPTRPLPPPKDVPPVIGTALAAPSPTLGDDDNHEWSIRLVVPKVAWEVVGKRSPKKDWPSLKVTVEEAVLTLPMGYDPATQLSENARNRILDVTGRILDRDEALKRLAARTPVLVSVSGRMLDPFFLQCTKSDTLIVVLGIPSSPAPELLPRPKGPKPSTRSAVDEKRPESREEIHRLQKTSLKGWELYVWEHEGATLFSLMVGTNRIKSHEEIAGSAVKGLEAIKSELVQLKKGELVFVHGQRLGAKPPDVSATAIIEYCKKLGLKAQ